MDRPASRRLLRIKQVIELTGRSRSLVYGDPSFPRPVKVGARASAWVADEIDAWITARIAARDTAPGGRT